MSLGTVNIVIRLRISGVGEVRGRFISCLTWLCFHVRCNVLSSFEKRRTVSTS